MTRVIIVSDEFTPTEVEVLEEQLQAKLIEHRALRARYIPPNSNARVAAELARTDSGASLKAGDGNMVDAGQTTGPANPALSPLCPDCAWLAQDGDGPCATHRRACEGCGRGEREGVTLHDGEASKSKLGPCESPIVERWCHHCDPVGERYSDGRADPWDLSDEELFTSVPLPRSESHFYRDRREYDEHDDKSDIQPHERTTR